jgi:hypothetical protein
MFNFCHILLTSNSAHVLKQMLESYLNQAPRPIPNLQQQATVIAKEVIGTARSEYGTNGESTNGTTNGFKAPPDDSDGTNGEDETPRNEKELSELLPVRTKPEMKE